MRTFLQLFILIFLFTILQSCKKDKDLFIIGVSQCSEDLWRETVNNEIYREATFRQNMSVIIKSVKDDTKQQIRDIEDFIKQHVDLLVISPNESSSLTPIVSKAHQEGIPVILLDRKIDSEDYEAYVGADNRQLANQLGYYAANKLSNKGNIVVLRGLKGSTADTERYTGFSDAISNFPNIHIIAEDHGDFLLKPARDIMATIINNVGIENIDMVFAMNDPMAVGAYEALSIHNKLKRPVIIGIDGLYGIGGGIEYISDGLIDASFIYPTGGDKVIDVAYKILNDIPYERENLLNTAVIDHSNVRIIKLQKEQEYSLQSKVDFLSNNLNANLLLFSRQKKIGYILIGLICFSFILMVNLLVTNKQKNKLNKKLNKQNHDIKTHVQKLEEQQQQLLNLSKQLESATQAKLVFFTNISHEFKTPLSLVLGPVEEMLKSNSLIPKDRDSLQLIHRNGKRLMNLLNQVLSFRTYENGKMTMNWSIKALDKFLEEINPFFGHLMDQKKIDFTYQIDDGNYEMALDEDKIEKLYFNLISNALKYVNIGGIIDVHLRQIVKHKHNYAELSVFNSGSYIPEDKIKDVFKRLYHLDNQFHNSGIGLALSKSYVTLHNGSIYAESDELKGTRFIVELPIKKTNIKQIINVDEASKYRFSRENIELLDENQVNHNCILKDEEFWDDELPSILIIEDNKDMRTYIRDILSNQYNIIQAIDGKDGIEKAYKYLPALIISDIMMPGLDGFKVCQTLKGNILTQKIPIICLTVCATDEQKMKVYANGADAYITKPFNADVLKTRISKLIESRAIFNDSSIDNILGRDMKTLGESQVELINKIKIFVNSHIQENISVNELANYLGMSKSKFYRQFKDITEYSPIEFICRLKLKKGANIMLYERKSISEAAFESGYSSSSYFSKSFNKYYNMNPRDFVKKYTKL
ncbi:MAG: substrate-binding domain-containing protein [Bacteroidales bacterium]|nr:substrate-binding domain-containing protein [Bacteroidales bacterium]